MGSGTFRNIQNATGQSSQQFYEKAETQFVQSGKEPLDIAEKLPGVSDNHQLVPCVEHESRDCYLLGPGYIARLTLLFCVLIFCFY
jgi:hypothetical protein